MRNEEDPFVPALVMESEKVLKMMTMTINFADVISVGDIACGDKEKRLASDSSKIKREQVVRLVVS